MIQKFKKISIRDIQSPQATTEKVFLRLMIMNPFCLIDNLLKQITNSWTHNPASPA